jgi:hypothetical protein
VVLPIENGEPNYRDAVPPPLGLLSGFSPLYLSPIAGTPEVTAPVGKISYYSRISEKTEPMPISASVASSLGKYHCVYGSLYYSALHICICLTDATLGSNIENPMHQPVSSVLGDKKAIGRQKGGLQVVMHHVRTRLSTFSCSSSQYGTKSVSCKLPNCNFVYKTAS